MLARYRRRFSTPRASYRSGLEEAAGRQIREAGLPVQFEELRVPYTVPAKLHHYTPDFILPNGIVIETKGLFQTEDRQKHKLLKSLYPGLDIRLVFQNANARIAKKSKTTYAKWADTIGIPWAHKTIPPAWLHEPANPTSIKQLKEFGWQVA